jgi:hypothetical protein
VTAAIRRAIEENRFPRAPRLDPLRSAVAKLDPRGPQEAAGGRKHQARYLNPKGRPPAS